jgi:hypothetical protein
MIASVEATYYFALKYGVESEAHNFNLYHNSYGSALFVVLPVIYSERAIAYA